MSNLKRNPYIWDIGNQDERDLIHKYECVVAKCENIKVTKHQILIRKGGC